MSTVTERVREIKQPRKGYIKLSQFEINKMNDGNYLFEKENIHSSIVGMAVDYLTRFLMGERIEDAFHISLAGAYRASQLGNENAYKKACYLASNISGIDDKSIINACKLVTFDVWKRNASDAPTCRGADEINPDKETINNINIMVYRSFLFWEEKGPIIKSGFTFGPSGYTGMITSGDGDFLTSDTLWEFKVLRKDPDIYHRLQLLIYWIMGQHSGKDVFKNINKIGIYNPRLNISYILDILKIDDNIIKTVESEVIGY